MLGKGYVTWLKWLGKGYVIWLKLNILFLRLIMEARIVQYTELHSVRFISIFIIKLNSHSGTCLFLCCRCNNIFKTFSVNRNYISLLNSTVELIRCITCSIIAEVSCTAWNQGYGYVAMSEACCRYCRYFSCLALFQTELFGIWKGLCVK